MRFSTLVQVSLFLGLICVPTFADDLEAGGDQSAYASKYVNEYEFMKEETSDDAQSGAPNLQVDLESDDFAIRAQGEDAPSLPD